MNILQNMLDVNFGMAVKNPLKAFKYFRAYKNRLKQLSLLLDANSTQIQKYLDEFENKTELFTLIKSAAEKHQLGDLSGASRLLKSPVQYVATRILKPSFVVETGVGIGISSMFYLEAMRLNKKGHLHSIDLPRKSYEIPEGIHDDFMPENLETGWLVPTQLKNRWTLHFGNAKTELPKLLEELKEIDIFTHDSEHTYEFMMFEFETAWKYLKKGGLLLSDDINWNNSFNDYAKKMKTSPISFSAFGGMRKI